MKKCEIIQVIETVTTWEVKCPYCKYENYAEVNEDVDWDTATCSKCKKTYIVNLKEYLEKQRG